MRNMRFALPVLLAGLACLAVACGDDPRTASPAAAEQESTVYTSFYPTAYFTRRIAGETLRVVCPLPPDADPVFWQPSRETVQALQAADLIVLNGAGFEQWTQAVSLPESRVVDTSRALEEELITYETVTHSHGGGGEHTHEGLDGHTWLDPLQAKMQARAIRDALRARFPERSAAYAGGFDALARDFDGLHARLTEIAAKLEGVRLLCSHPAYNYLARRYGWEVQSFDLDPAEALDTEQLEHVVEHASGATLLLWESAPLAATAEALAARGVTSVVFSPGELLDPADEAAGLDYLGLMRRNLERLETAASGR